jgi:hypothetical protein
MQVHNLVDVPSRQHRRRVRPLARRAATSAHRCRDRVTTRLAARGCRPLTRARRAARIRRESDQKSTRARFVAPGVSPGSGASPIGRRAGVSRRHSTASPSTRQPRTSRSSK